MLLQDMRDIAANGNDSQVLSPRHIEASKHEPLGDTMPAKLRRNFRMRKNHAIACPVIFGHRQLPAHLDLKPAFRFIVHDG